MVHRFKLFNSNIIYDANACSLHVINDIASDLLAAMPNESYAAVLNKSLNVPSAITRKYKSEDINEAIEEIRALITTGELFAPDEPEPDPDALEVTNIFKSLCIHLAHDCNMRCAYCFATGGSFGAKRELMNYETACAAIDFIISASSGRTNIEIDFFGGEPLLNFDVLKRVVDYARENGRKAGKIFRFTLTTNGLLLDDGIIDYVNENMDNLVLSIDGRKEINDAVRKHLDGAGTYDDIVAKFKAVTKRRNASWYVRGTYTAKNIDFANDVLHLADIGFSRISVEPVISPLDISLEITPGDKDVIFAEYERLAWAMYEREKKGNPIEFFHFNVDLEGGPCLARRIKGCGAGYEYAAVTPDGGIYPCHQFAGVEQFRLGNVFDGIDAQAIVDIFKAANLYKKSECRVCWAKFLCGGGCAANAWQYNRDIDKPNELYCSIFRKRMECALWLKCAPHIAPHIARASVEGMFDA